MNQTLYTIRLVMVLIGSAGAHASAQPGRVALPQPQKEQPVTAMAPEATPTPFTSPFQQAPKADADPLPPLKGVMARDYGSQALASALKRAREALDADAKARAAREAKLQETAAVDPTYFNNAPGAPNVNGAAALVAQPPTLVASNAPVIGAGAGPLGVPIVAAPLEPVQLPVVNNGVAQPSIVVTPQPIAFPVAGAVVPEGIPPVGEESGEQVDECPGITTTGRNLEQAFWLRYITYRMTPGSDTMDGEQLFQIAWGAVDKIYRAAMTTEESDRVLARVKTKLQALLSSSRQADERRVGMRDPDRWGWSMMVAQLVCPPPPPPAATRQVKRPSGPAHEKPAPRTAAR
jgi:hypothetical protein